MYFQNPVGHSQKFAKSEAGQINKNVPSPDEILKHYSWRPKNHAQIAKLTGTDTTGVYANMLLYTLQRLLTARAKHKEKGFSWWVCVAKELAADAGLDINKYNRARTRLVKLSLIDTMQGPSPVRAGLMNCTKIRIRYEKLYADSKDVSSYVYETKLIEIESLEAKPLTLKTL